MKYQRRGQQNHSKINEYDQTSIITPNNNSNIIYERLLQSQIGDFRKNAADLILIPYLVLIRKLSDSEVYNIIRNWLDKCNRSRPLDPNYTDNRINTSVKTEANSSNVFRNYKTA
jgi:hypothetical protein